MLDAVAHASGAAPVILLLTWNGGDKATGMVPATRERRPVNVEWQRRPGRFCLDLNIFGSGLSGIVNRLVHLP
ncbi:MAG: hypothetical protein ACHP7N_18050 [Caulobacterales bacterium]